MLRLFREEPGGGDSGRVLRPVAGSVRRREPKARRGWPLQRLPGAFGEGRREGRGRHREVRRFAVGCAGGCRGVADEGRVTRKSRGGPGALGTGSGAVG